MVLAAPMDLKQLRDSALADNPVNIAGYGHESTHRGYLMHMLNRGERAVGASILRSLYRSAGADLNILSGNPEGITCLCEQPLGVRRRVDLLIDWDGHRLPIELKTDSGPSGEDQFEVMSKAAKEKGYEPGLVLLLGSSQVQWFKLDGFKSLTASDILNALEGLENRLPPFFVHWLRALAQEVGRHRLARTVPTDDVQWRDYGYRTWKNLMYYQLDDLRRDLKRVLDPKLQWDIYDGGYNAVMNLTTDRFWIRAPTCPGLKIYFEFNDESFVMKVHRDESTASPEATRGYFTTLRPVLSAYCQRAGIPRPAAPRANRYDRTWLTVTRWPTDLRDSDSAARLVRSLLRAVDEGGELRNQL